MQTLEEIDTRIEAQRAVATQARASLAALTETRAALKRTAAVPENIVQRARRVKIEAKAAADAEKKEMERLARADFEEPVRGAHPEKLRAFFDALVAEVLESVPIEGDTWTVKMWAGLPSRLGELVAGAGLSVDAIMRNHRWYRYPKIDRVKNRVMFLIDHVTEVFSVDGLAFTLDYAAMFGWDDGSLAITCHAL